MCTLPPEYSTPSIPYPPDTLPPGYPTPRYIYPTLQIPYPPGYPTPKYPSPDTLPPGYPTPRYPTPRYPTPQIPYPAGTLPHGYPLPPSPRRNWIPYHTQKEHGTSVTLAPQKGHGTRHTYPHCGQNDTRLSHNFVSGR